MGKFFLLFQSTLQKFCWKGFDGGGEITQIGYYELLTHDSFSIFKNGNEKAEFKKGNRLIIDALPEEEKGQVKKRYDIIKPILLLRKAKTGDLRAITEFSQYYSKYLEEDNNISKLQKEMLISEISEVNIISTRTVKRYLATYLKYEEEFSTWH